MANGNQRASDTTNWQLQGIRAERTAIGERLKYLDEAEKGLRDRAMLSTSPAPKQSKNTKAQGRKRHISPEAREKMREAARKRWEQRKSEVQTADVPPPVVATA